MKLGFTSDIHLDINKQYFTALDLYESAKELGLDHLIIAGDISNGSNYLKELLNIFKDIKIVFVFGNHDFYLLNKDLNSFDLMFYYCSEKGCLARAPIILGDYALVGNSGWYDYSFGPEKHSIERYDEMRFDSSTWPDKKYCNWVGTSNIEMTNIFLKELTFQLEEVKGKRIIAISHVVPHKDFIIEKNFSEWNYNNAFFGTTKLHELYKKYKVEKAFFGHTHSDWHKIIDNIEYVCSPIGYYFEFNYGLKTIKEYLKSKIHILEI